MTFPRKGILYSFLILTLAVRAFIPAGFMPDMMGASAHHEMMVNCPGMGMDMPAPKGKSPPHRPCLYAADFITGQAATPPAMPVPRVYAAHVPSFFTRRAVPARSVSNFSPRGPPV